MAAMEWGELKFLVSMPVIKFKVFESLGNITKLNIYSGIDINWYVIFCFLKLQ